MPFAGRCLRGLGALLPPLLTVVILVWIGRTLSYYVLDPVTTMTRDVLAWSIAEIHTDLPDKRPGPDPGQFISQGQSYRQLPGGRYFRPACLRSGANRPGPLPPGTPQGIYRRFVEIEYMRPWVVVPVFVLVFVLVMYVLGSLFAAGMGRVLWGLAEHNIEPTLSHRVCTTRSSKFTDYMCKTRTGVSCAGGD